MQLPGLFGEGAVVTLQDATPSLESIVSSGGPSVSWESSVSCALLVSAEAKETGVNNPSSRWKRFPKEVMESQAIDLNELQLRRKGELLE